MNFIEQHAGKVGAGGTLATWTLSDLSAVGAIGVAFVTIAAVLPVALRRWRVYLRGK